MRVLANGCFDILHPGHLAHLEEARTFGDELVVAVTQDQYVLKTGRPIQSVQERMTMLRGLRCVSAVVSCQSGTEAILTIRPKVFAKGVDYVESGLMPDEIQACKDVGAEVRFTKADKASTTELLRRIESAFLERKKIMWNKTAESLPPKHEVLAVIHKLSSRGEDVHEDAIWDGEKWCRRGSQEALDFNYYHLWRRLET